MSFCFVVDASLYFPFFLLPSSLHSFLSLFFLSFSKVKRNGLLRKSKSSKHQKLTDQSGHKLFFVMMLNYSQNVYFF